MTRALFECREQTTYKLSAIAASSLLMATAVTATWYRFAMHTGAADVSPFEVALTLLLVLGGTVSYSSSCTSNIIKLVLQQAP